MYLVYICPFNVNEFEELSAKAREKELRAHQEVSSAAKQILHTASKYE